MQIFDAGKNDDWMLTRCSQKDILFDLKKKNIEFVMKYIPDNGYFLYHNQKLTLKNEEHADKTILCA